MILDKIAQSARKRVDGAKKLFPPERCRAAALAQNPDTGFPFEKALSHPGVNFICEVKRASPSRGLIAPEFPYLEIARDYEAAGAAAVSVLTEPEFFLGDNRYLSEIAACVSVPVLRKDFIIDEYQVYEAKTLGASAVLLICSLLGGAVKDYIRLCGRLGLSALVEVHDEAEMRAAARAGARVVGVNNRDLRDFSVNTGNSVRLRSLAPAGTLFVAESGIRSASDVAALRECGVNAVLVGEALMTAADRKQKLMELRGDSL